MVINKSNLRISAAASQPAPARPWAREEPPEMNWLESGLVLLRSSQLVSLLVSYVAPARCRAVTGSPVTAAHTTIQLTEVVA